MVIVEWDRYRAGLGWIIKKGRTQLKTKSYYFKDHAYLKYQQYELYTDILKNRTEQIKSVKN